MRSLADIFSDYWWPVRFEHLSLPQAVGLFVLLAAPVLWMGIRSLRWLGPTRQTVAIALRLAVLCIAVMIVAGVRWHRQHRDLEVIVLRDVSASTANVPAGDSSIQAAIDQFLRATIGAEQKPADDRLGVVRFDADPSVDFLPDTEIRSQGRALRASNVQGTDIAEAIRLGLSCFSGNAMRRLLLISDGNSTQGDVREALAAASAANVPIDIIPLSYRLSGEILVDRLIAPATLRQGEPYTVEVILRSTHVAPISGRLTVMHQNAPVDLDPNTPGIQASQQVVVQNGANPVRLRLPPSSISGLNEFRAVFAPDSLADDSILGNNSAETFSFIKGRGRILYVDNVPDGEGSHLAAALQSDEIGQIDADRISPDQFPQRLIDLQNYDAVILANVPRGAGGLSEQQEQNLARYVHDLGGGLLMVGGPEALGAGGWQGSQLERVLPVNLNVPAQRVLPAGALVLVLDHSGSMSGPMPRDPTVTKQQSANESAVLALDTLTRQDLIGVIAFDVVPHWVIPLALNRDPLWAIQRIRGIPSNGGTSIGPALEEAVRALAKVGRDEAAARRILLLTDGHSQPWDYTNVLRQAASEKITISTIAVGGDADRQLLSDLATRGRGTMFLADNPAQLKQIFVREARTLRRNLLHEPPTGVTVVSEPASAELLKTLGNFSLPVLRGIVLTSRKSEPTAQIILSAANQHRDPVYAQGQAGLGRAAVFTSDATRKWAADWIASESFASFWAQAVRGVARPPMNSDFDVQVVQDGPRARIVIEAVGESGHGRSFYSFIGRLASHDQPDELREIQFVQTGPGRYEAPLESTSPGNHIAAVQFTGPDGARGTLLAGATLSESTELRDLRSNDAMLTEVAVRTGGRIFEGMDSVSSAALFAREGLTRTASSMPVTQVLLTMLVGMIVLDVAVRRIAWDRLQLAAMFSSVAQAVRRYTTVRAVESTATLQALKRVRQATTESLDAAEPSPDPSAKFDVPGVEGDITRVVGGATDKPLPKAPKKVEPKGVLPETDDQMNGLLAAKRRAQQQIKQKEEGN